MEDSDEPPLVDGEQIVFNATPEPEGHEPLVLKRVPTEDYSFCKTFGKPYDTLVCAVLAVAAEHAPANIRVLSDGRAEDWEGGLAWASEVLGCTIPNPIP